MRVMMLYHLVVMQNMSLITDLCHGTMYIIFIWSLHKRTFQLVLEVPPLMLQVDQQVVCLKRFGGHSTCTGLLLPTHSLAWSIN